MGNIINALIFQVAAGIVMAFNWFFVLTGDPGWGHETLVGMDKFAGEVSS
jgi:hypothetical protein